MPRASLQIVKAVLAAEGHAGRHWLRPKGVRASSDGEGVHEVHLSVAGAIRLNEMRDVPSVLRKLIASRTVRWEPGSRLGKSSVVLAPHAAPGRFRFAELFAGIGGFRVGLDALGGECVWASELDRHAATTCAAFFSRVSS